MFYEPRLDPGQPKPLARMGYALHAVVAETFRMTRPE